MTVRQKIIVCLVAMLFILALMLVWAVFVARGLTSVDEFLHEVALLITIAVGLISAFAGHQSRGGDTQNSAPATSLAAATPAAASPLAAVPLQDTAPPSSVAPQEPAAPTLQ